MGLALYLKLIGMNQKGQGFSVFKLLIAAIVAVFILTILLQILSQITPPTQGNPNQEAASKIKSLISALGAPERTKIVIFKKDSPLLSTRTIATQTGALVSSQICLDLSPAFADAGLFTGDIGVLDNTDRVIEYTGNQDLQAKLLILCDSEDRIDDTITSFADGGQIPNCSSPGNATKTLCYVSIVPTS